MSTVPAPPLSAPRASAARAAVPLTVEEIEREIEVNLEINHSLIDGEIVRVIVGITEAARAIAARLPQAPPSASGAGAMSATPRRHFSRRADTGDIEIVDREFDFVRAVLPYDYRFTCNADQWEHANRICQALEGPMASLGVARALPEAAPPRSPAEKE